MIPVDAGVATTPEIFLRSSSSKLTDDFLPRLRSALDVIPDAAVWSRDAGAANSVGNTLLHVEGNLRQWIVSGVGGEEDTRIRDQEFSVTGGKDKAALLEGLTRTVAQAASVIEGVPTERLSRRLTIQGYSVTTLEAIYHAVEHFSYHLGQVIYAAKAISGKDLGLYKL